MWSIITEEDPRECPVLFLIFNRPEQTSRVFEQIRKFKPRKLFIAADGPRKGFVEDARKCLQTRNIVEQIDWECNCVTLFRTENLGCKKSVSDAISWFFENVDRGIILEDDCLPEPTFFRFCSDLLSAYRDDDRVALVSGFNPLATKMSSNEFRFSIYAGIWGWATWKRSWKHYDPCFDGLQEFLKSQKIKSILKTSPETEYWENILIKAASENQNSWAYPWLYSWWKRGCLGIIPLSNLVKNIGFGGDATHTIGCNQAFVSSYGQALFPLQMHSFDYDAEFDRLYARKIYLNEATSSQPTSVLKRKSRVAGLVNYFTNLLMTKNQ
jgi:hypothetical protein